ncbi:peptidoglycan-binding protein LysM, partial [Paraburkholderia phymatum]
MGATVIAGASGAIACRIGALSPGAVSSPAALVPKRRADAWDATGSIAPAVSPAPVRDVRAERPAGRSAGMSPASA